MKKPLKIAHRGYSEFYKDNSIKAFEEAILNKFDMIELDIQICKSGDIVIYHDTHINGKSIENMSLKELYELNPDIILIDYLFELFDKYNQTILIYLDLKGKNNLLISTLIKYFDSNPHIITSTIYIASFNFNYVSMLFEEKQKNRNLLYNIGIITCNLYTINQLDLLSNIIDFISCHWNMCDENTINYCNINKKIIFVYTYYEKNEALLEYLLSMNVDGIITNCKI
jgi:glycerophosphoryl diester phosphodiesterase